MPLGNNDPWGRGTGGGGNLEETLSRLLQAVRSVKAIGPIIVAAVVFVVWMGSGVYVVGPGEQGVVRQFGKVIKKTSAGLNYRFPWPVQAHNVVNVEAVRTLDLGVSSAPVPDQFGRVRPASSSSLMLTGDENIVDAKLIVQYRVKDPVKFLFRLRAPESTLRAATEVALRSRVGNTTVDEVLTVGRAKVEQETRRFLQQLMDTYQSGILITAVKLQAVDAPEQVKDAFHEVVRAREDREKLIRQAEGYKEDLIPKARGEAQQIIRAAEAYMEERILRAAGDTARFTSMLVQYRKAPRVTRQRLHLETMERILPEVEKIILDSKGGNIVPLLPLKDITIMQRGSLADQASGSLAYQDRGSRTEQERDSQTEQERGSQTEQERGSLSRTYQRWR